MSEYESEYMGYGAAGEDIGNINTLNRNMHKKKVQKKNKKSKSRKGGRVSKKTKMGKRKSVRKPAKKSSYVF